MTTIPDFLFWYRAKCLNVVDGDTTDVLTDLGFRVVWEQRVRFHGMNAYELHDPDTSKWALAVKGKEFVAAAIGGKDVVLYTYLDRQEKYGRWLADVWYFRDGQWILLNDELVVEALAVKA